MKESLLVNTLGHSAGVLIFGIFLVLLLQDRAARRLRGGIKSILAAILALAWNLASLIVLGADDPQSRFIQLTIAVGFSVLSLLPAVLFDLCLAQRDRFLVRLGYALSIVATALHVAELFHVGASYHRWALTLITIGFGSLTVIAAVLAHREGGPRASSRLVGTMSLFLLAMSFVHLGGAHAEQIWSQELAFHHAAIPLALLILLQDYRFILLDAFLRFLVNVFLAAVFVFAAAMAWKFDFIPKPDTPFHQALLLAGAGLLLILFALLRSSVQRWLTRLRRPNEDALLRNLRIPITSEEEYLATAAHALGEFMGAEQTVVDDPNLRLLELARPTLVSEFAGLRTELEKQGTEVVIPLRISSTDQRQMLLGRRSGGRRYLSEDLQALGRASALITEQIEHYRESEMRRLVAQAELRALQSQIHPHFLFNALNTLYGIIPKEARGARDTVLNLADIFRYFLETRKSFVPLQDEMHIVKAYLDVERLRLGDKLHTEIDIAPETLAIQIPILSIQPLVENAVKHGIASLAVGGSVSIQAHLDSGGSLQVTVSDSGPGFAKSDRVGVGLENVERRLALCFGDAAYLKINSSSRGSAVTLSIPASSSRPVAVLL